MFPKRPSLDKIADVTLLRDRAYVAIKEAILNLTFPPGHELKEATLSAELGISKTPIREALMQLMQEGFVKILPFRGAFVTEIEPIHLKEIYHLREILEGEAARVAARECTDEELARLREVVEAIRVAVTETDYEGYTEANQEFHFMILAKLNNSRVDAILRNLEDHLRRMMLAVIYAGGMTERMTEYERILQALEARDGDAACRAMQEHLRNVVKKFQVAAQETAAKGEPAE